MNTIRIGDKDVSFSDMAVIDNCRAYVHLNEKTQKTELPSSWVITSWFSEHHVQDKYFTAEGILLSPHLLYLDGIIWSEAVVRSTHITAEDKL
jgi:hypothetical protein